MAMTSTSWFLPDLTNLVSRREGVGFSVIYVVLEDPRWLMTFSPFVFAPEVICGNWKHYFVYEKMNYNL